MVLSFHFAVLIVHFYFELSTSEEEVWDGVTKEGRVGLMLTSEKGPYENDVPLPACTYSVESRLTLQNRVCVCDQT